ncbi:MAG: hypothetical protein AB1705_13320 [Verrucomicrobiota bacterium]
MNQRAVKQLQSGDPVMAGLIERVGVIRLKPRRLPPFQSLIQAIIHQQLSGKAAGTILDRFRALFGNDGFPAPEAILRMPSERLRGAGLSKAKTGFILGVAERAQAGQVPTLAACDGMMN